MKEGDVNFSSNVMNNKKLDERTKDQIILQFSQTLGQINRYSSKNLKK